MFEAGPNHIFQLHILQAIAFHRPHILVGQIDPGNSLVVGRERNGKVKLAVHR